MTTRFVELEKGTKVWFPGRLKLELCAQLYCY